MRRRGLLLGMVTFLALGIFFVPSAVFATTQGVGGILTSQGNDISVQIQPNSTALTESLYVFPNGPGTPGTLIAQVALNGVAQNTNATFCIYAASATTCGANSLAPGKTALVNPTATGNVPVAGTPITFGIVVSSSNLAPGFTFNTYTLYSGNGTSNNLNPDFLSHNNNGLDGPQPGGGNLEFVGFEDLMGIGNGFSPTAVGTKFNFPPLASCINGLGNPFTPPGSPGSNLLCSDRDFGDTTFLFGGLLPVPPPGTSEPSSLLLLGSGLAGLSGIAWRRRSGK